MLKIVICDDLQADRERIEKFTREYLDERKLPAEVRAYDHPDKMIQDCEKFRPHLYLLDIVMPMITGIEAARELRWNQKESQIIFTTSEPSFALESFDVNPINYLLKPIDKKKLFETIDLALKHVDYEEEKTVSVKVKGGLVTLFLDDIQYLEYKNHVITYHLLSGEDVSTSTLRIGFKEYLSTNHENSNIVQCHESFAVNIAAVDKLTKTDIIVRNKDMIPVSKSRYQEVMDSYMNYRFD